jgi:excisionase family DNA binding protein
MDKMITTEIAAKILNVTSARVRQLISQNRLKSQKIGRDHLLSLDTINNFAACEQKKAGRPKK